MRVAGCLEIQFILLILTDHVSFWDCVLITGIHVAFCQFVFLYSDGDARVEGGFALAVGGLSLAGALRCLYRFDCPSAGIGVDGRRFAVDQVGQQVCLVFLKLIRLKLCPTGFFM